MAIISQNSVKHGFLSHLAGIRGEFWRDGRPFLKKQSQFTRIAYSVMRIAKRYLKKQSQFLKGRNERNVNCNKGL